LLKRPFLPEAFQKAKLESTQEFGVEMERTPILEAHSLSKQFGAIQALEDVDFEVFAGEVVGLVGDNGAGKSTLVKIISGVYQPETGNILFEGRPVTINKPRDSNDLGIETVYQDLALCDNLDVVANLFIGREAAKFRIPFFHRLNWLDEASMEKKAIELLEELHVSLPSVRNLIASMSGGQRQSVAVARSVLQDCKIVILDEPTAALGMEQTLQVKKLITKLKERNLGVVLISHNLQEILDITDRIIVLRLGRRTATFETGTTRPEQIVAAITGVA
jgi:D-xylose transport system ATP-binding protein